MAFQSKNGSAIRASRIRGIFLETRGQVDFPIPRFDRLNSKLIALSHTVCIENNQIQATTARMDGCVTFPPSHNSATYSFRTILVFCSRWFSIFCLVEPFCLPNVLLIIHNEASEEFNGIFHHRTRLMLGNLVTRFN